MRKKWVILSLVFLFTFSLSYSVSSIEGCQGDGGICKSSLSCSSIPDCPQGNDLFGFPKCWSSDIPYTCESITDQTVCDSFLVNCQWVTDFGGGNLCPSDRCERGAAVITDYPFYDSSVRDVDVSCTARSSSVCNDVTHPTACNTFSCGGVDRVCTRNDRSNPHWGWYTPGLLTETGSDFCNDGIDNDCDGNLDNLDDSCQGNAAYDCFVNGAVISSNCGADGICSTGEKVTITAYITGDCKDATLIQVDALDSKGTCDVQYTPQDEGMSGIFGTLVMDDYYDYILNSDGSDSYPYCSNSLGSPVCGSSYATLTSCNSQTYCTQLDDSCMSGYNGNKNYGAWSGDAVRCNQLLKNARLSSTWTVGTISEACSGKTVNAVRAKLWNGAPGSGAAISALSTDTDGEVTFMGSISYDSCTDYSGWVKAIGTHASCQSDDPFGFEECVRDDDDNGVYDHYCDNDNTIKGIVIDYNLGDT